MCDMKKFVKMIMEKADGVPCYRERIPGYPLATYLLVEAACRKLSKESCYDRKAFLDALVLASRTVGQDLLSNKSWDMGVRAAILELPARGELAAYANVVRGLRYVGQVLQAGGLNGDDRKQIIDAAHGSGICIHNRDYRLEEQWPDAVSRMVSELVLGMRQYVNNNPSLCRIVSDADMEEWITHFRAGLARRVFDVLFAPRPSHAGSICGVRVDDIFVIDVVCDILPLPPLGFLKEYFGSDYNNRSRSVYYLECNAETGEVELLVL